MRLVFTPRLVLKVAQHHHYVRHRVQILVRHGGPGVEIHSKYLLRFIYIAELAVTDSSRILISCMALCFKDTGNDCVLYERHRLFYGKSTIIPATASKTDQMQLQPKPCF
jgi:hypothetical protein